MVNPLSRSVERSLVLGGVASAALGVGFATIAVLAPGVLDAMYRAVGPGVVSDMGPAARLGAGIYGGLMAGLGVTLALLGRGAPVARAAGLGLLSWYVVDSGASIALGYPLNAVTNAGFLAVFTPVVVAALRRERSGARAPA